MLSAMPTENETPEPDESEAAREAQTAELAALLDQALDPQKVKIADLTEHPRNYKTHPDDQVAHLGESILEHGFYRNVVIARDGTILAGHGVVLAATKVGLDEVPAVRLDLDPNEPQALKILAGDNELPRFAVVDDRALTEMLKEISEESATGLLGTGYDEMVLANLLMVTRHTSEISGIDAAAEWTGMPDYEPAGDSFKFIVTFTTEADRNAFMEKYKMREVVAITHGTPKAISGIWPIPDETRNNSKVKWGKGENGLDDHAEPR